MRSRSETPRCGRRIESGSFAAVIAAYLRSERFARLRPSTQRAYTYVLGLAQQPEILGLVPVEEMRPALTQAFLDGLASTPGTQQLARAVLRAVEKWAILRELLPHPITIGTEVIGSRGGHRPWRDDELERAVAVAPRPLGHAFLLAANTGQRGSDLVRMRWQDLTEYRGRVGLSVRQQKTGRELWIPLPADFVPHLLTWRRGPGHILVKADGRPWSRSQLTSAVYSFRAAHPEFADLTLHGLRATAVVRLRRAGASIPQICDWVGMSEKMVQRYCRFSEQKDNAIAAVISLEKRRAATQVID